MTQDEVITRLKNLMVKRLRLSPQRVELLQPDTLLLKDGLGLDSLDCVELLLGIEEEFDLMFEQDDEEWMHHFSCLESLSQLVLAAKGELA